MLNAQSWSFFAQFFCFVNPFCLNGGPFEDCKKKGEGDGQRKGTNLVLHDKQETKSLVRREVRLKVT